MAHREEDRAPAAFGAALRRYRTARRLSQMELALRCEISSRHLSFLESGRAQPSRSMAALLAEGLALPLGARNALMQAAGFAPLYPASALDSAVLRPFRAALSELMARHAPNPALICDRYWNLIEANRTAATLLGALGGPSVPPNLVRMIAENPRAESLIANLGEVISELTDRLQLEALEAGFDPKTEALLDVLAQAAARHGAGDEGARVRSPLAPLQFNSPAGRLNFLSAIAHFGTSEDVTIRDIRVELFFPADDATRQALAALDPA